MNWLDVSFIVMMVILVAAGAKVGSVWTSACLGAGFVGMAAIDIFALALAERLGSGPASFWVAAGLLFGAGLIIVLVPGWLLSRLASLVMLDIVDGLVGFLTGLFAVVVLVTLSALLIVPAFPKLEKTSVWKKSIIVRPLQHFLEEKIDHPR